VSAPDQNDWNLQLLRVFIFDNLVYNIDRNAGTPDYAGLADNMIDHTAASKHGQLKAAKDLTSFPVNDRISEDLNKETSKRNAANT